MTVSKVWFPRLSAGLEAPSGAHLETLISVSWLLMTELFAYLEDLDGAEDDPPVIEGLALRLGELAFDLDRRLRGELEIEDIHHFPLLLQYGLTDLAQLRGPEAAFELGLRRSDGIGESFQSRGQMLTSVYTRMVEQFPGRLFNTLLPTSQGQTLRTLRAWNKLCGVTNTDAAFLAPLMRAL